MKEKIIGGALWFVMLLVMGASVSHLAATFGTLEVLGLEIVGWLPAIAVDAGLLAITYAAHTKRQKGDSPRFLHIGMAIFVALSVFANVDHATTVVTERYGITEGWFGWQTSWQWQFAKVWLLSGVLPLLIWFVAEVIGVLFANSTDKKQGTAIARSDKLRSHSDKKITVTVTKPTTDKPKLLPPPDNMPNDLAEAVAVMWQYGSYRKAEAATGVNRETLRQRVLLAKQDYTDYTSKMLG